MRQLEMLERQATPGEAIRLARECTGDIHLLMTDVVMPETNGFELAGKLLAVQTGFKCLYNSGYMADVIALQEVLDAVVNFLPKPFSPEDLGLAVRRVLDHA
jgi:DNA-binding NtrC family response regulator